MDIDPSVGGHILLFIESPEFNAQMDGVFREVVPCETLRYSWEWNGDGEITEVTVSFRSQGDATQILVEHTGFLKEESRQMHDEGWDSYISGLTDFLKSNR